MLSREQKTIRKRFETLIGARLHSFPKERGRLDAPKLRGVYINLRPTSKSCPCRDNATGQRRHSSTADQSPVWAVIVRKEMFQRGRFRTQGRLLVSLFASRG